MKKMDIADQKPAVGGFIDRVGLEGVELPIQFQNIDEVSCQQAKITAMVSLDEKHLRGVHMSRIYLSLQDFLENNMLNLKTLKKLLNNLVQSQKGISKKAYLKIGWKWPVKRLALKTKNLKGWRYYPVFYEARLNKEQSIEYVMGLTVTYSSTCPCSAGLARAIVQSKFQQDFPSSSLNKEQVTRWLGKEDSIVATPHAQKSHAHLRLKITEEKQSFLDIINEVERCLKTPVQAAVKKEDEGEFARLNGENLMFSEDAARKIKKLLHPKTWIEDFYIQVKHLESLHPFEVACHLTKQISGGWRA